MGGGEVSGKSLRPGKIRVWRQFLFLSAVLFLSTGHGVAQRSGSDIVADNLDRVAATADQILDVLGRDAGLIVEMKRVLAQDAGAGGELLEESDLAGCGKSALQYNGVRGGIV